RVSRLNSLRMVWLSSTDVSNDGIASLANSPQLRILAVFEANIDDEGIASLSGKTSIRELVLCQTSVTGKGLISLKSLPNLRFLLYDQQATGPVPAGVEQEIASSLGQLTQLRRLEIGGNILSADTIAAIRKALPNVEVVQLKKGDRRR